MMWFQLSLSFIFKSKANATEKDRIAFVAWWTAMARRLKDSDYRMSFNLLIELGFGARKTHGIRCKNSYRKSVVKYTQRTKNVTEAI